MRAGVAFICREPDGAGDDGVEPENAAQEFGSSGPDESGNTEYLAFVQLQGCSARVVLSCQLVQCEYGRALLAWRSWIQIVHGPAGHGRYHVGDGHLRVCGGCYGFSIAQNRDAVGNIFYFLKNMRDIQYGAPAGRERSYQAEEPLCIGERQAAGWFIQNQDPAAGCMPDAWLFGYSEQVANMWIRKIIRRCHNGSGVDYGVKWLVAQCGYRG